jgi:glucosamine--fructose-6-phosphate aminotransferase (isomerizing)
MGIFEQQIGRQPEAVQALLDADVPQLDPQRPVVLTGIGTSLHACRVAASWAAILTGGRLRPIAVESHELALTGSLTPDDQIVVVSHRGTKRYPNDVLRLGREIGARTVAISGLGAADLDADVVLRTCEDERAGTHTVSYVTALTLLARLLGAMPGVDDDGRLAGALRTVPDAQRSTIDSPTAGTLASRLVDHSPLLITGSGLDAITADEAALKLKEGAYRWAEGMSVEFALHGTPAVFAPPMAAVCIRPDHDDGGRTADLAGLLEAIGVVGCTAGDGPDDDLWFAPVDTLVRPLVAIVAFQRLVASLAPLVGSSPESIRTDAEPWRSAILRVQL